jgi:predicted SAM-dependent methyltransferase
MKSAPYIGAALPVEFKGQQQLDPTLANYLANPGPHCLEIGAGWNTKPGWLATDLNPPPGHACIKLDATKSFEIPSESFDFVYSEHMIEHVSFEDGRNMLEECNRILKPFGVIRIVTPSLGFLCRVISSDRGVMEDRYRNWSVKTWVPEAPKVTNAFFLNNFVRQWGHTFIYDRETLELALRLSGFEPVVSCELNNSEHRLLCGLANVGKIPRGFLDLESMVLEGTKARSVAAPAPRKCNLALGKRAAQSSISQWSVEANPGCEAARVVSGHFTGSYNCHTGLDSPPWWRVDLGEVQQISEVRIYNRISTDNAILARMSRLEIQVSDDDLTWKTVFRKETNTLLRGPTRTSPFIWIPEEQASGRYVRIQLLDKQYLHLEQVEIYGP